MLAIATILSCLLSTVVVAADDQYAALLKRQEPGTPQYDCHVACGSVISASRAGGFCDSTALTSNLDSCLECALQFNIWRFYGTSVERAATACGLSAQPAASEAASSPTSTASSASSATEAVTISLVTTSSEEVSTSPATTGSEAVTTSTAPTEAAAESDTSSSMVTSTTATTTTDAANSASATTSVAVFTGTANRIVGQEGLMAAGAGLIAYVLL